MVRRWLVESGLPAVERPRIAIRVNFVCSFNRVLYMAIFSNFYQMPREGIVLCSMFRERAD
jgi:hypothetical protein